MNTSADRMGRGRVRWLRAGLLLIVLGLTAGALLAQRRGGWRRSWDGEARTAREFPSDSTGTPTWTNPPTFERDVFTFVRVVYDGVGTRRGNGWYTDLPDSDLNFSYRLQQMTAMRVDPDGRILRLTDPDLWMFPFIYIVEPGGLRLAEPEVEALRRYLLNGGFLMLDDFWGEREWRNCEEEMRRVFPDRAFQELPLDHPVYHCVFDIRAKHQVPNVMTGTSSQWTGVTWERPDAQEVHHRAIFDDAGRILVIATHNTDNGDGWEREGENEYYFQHFSEKVAYPLGINILFYALTH